MVTPAQRNRQLPIPPTEDRRPSEWLWVGFGESDQIGIVQSANGSFAQGVIAGNEIPAINSVVQFTPGNPLGRIVVGTPASTNAVPNAQSARNLAALIAVPTTAQDPNNADGTASGTLVGRFVGDQIESSDTPTNTTFATRVTWRWTGSVWTRPLRHFEGNGAPGTISQAQRGDFYTDTSVPHLYFHNGTGFAPAPSP